MTKASHILVRMVSMGMGAKFLNSRVPRRPSGIKGIRLSQVVVLVVWWQIATHMATVLNMMCCFACDPLQSLLGSRAAGVLLGASL